MTSIVADDEIAALLAHVEPVFGAPHAVLKSGSIAAGLGNPKSDIDLLVLVPSERVTKFPILSHEGERIVDAEYISLPRRTRIAADIRDRVEPSHLPGAAALHARYENLWTLSRLAIGSVLHADAAAGAFLAGIKEPWLAEAISEFWALEAWRRWSVARWLYAAKPRTAAWRCGMALFAAADARLASQGQYYVNPKWVSEKVARAADPALRAMLERARAGMLIDSPGEAEAFVESASGLLDELLAPFAPLPRLVTELRLADGVSLRSAGGSTILAYHDLHGAEIRDHGLRFDPDAPTWSGGVGDVPPGAVMALFERHLLWPSIRAGGDAR